jgi:molecular chaperone DnaJ
MDVMDQDLYKILGVTRQASQTEIKKAYRKMAKQYHPDVNQDDEGAEAKFKEISAAYEILKDKEKRAAYDRHGMAAFQNGGRGQDFGGFSDIFEEIFGDFMGGGARGRGRSGRRSTAQRGNDVRFDLEIELEDAFHGVDKTISVPTYDVCDTCDGSGAADDSGPVTCKRCNGAGRVRAQQGFFTIERACQACGGQGTVIDEPCPKCVGAGRIRRDKKLEVSVPAGIEDGTRIRLAGEGEVGPRGGPAGDLYVFVHVASHPIFKRDGADLICHVPIPIHTATLGGEMEVPLINGEVETIDIDDGVQTGHQIRLANHGMPVLRSRSRGDMYVELRVETPVNLTDRQIELMEEFGKISGQVDNSIHPESKSFFDRIKSFVSSGS